MSYKNLIPAVAGAGAALALLFTPTTPAMAQTTATAQSSVSAAKAATSAAAAQAVRRKSVKCITPRNKRANYSWGDGTTSTTVYFNNHCSHRVYVTLHFKSFAGTMKRCLATNGGTSGKKKFHHGAAWNLKKITNGC